MSPGAMGPDLQQLGALCPSIPSPTREAVYLHFQKDGSRALDALLGMSSPTQHTLPYTEQQVRGDEARDVARGPSRPLDLHSAACRRPWKTTLLWTPHTASTTSAAVTR